MFDFLLKYISQPVLSCILTFTWVKVSNQYFATSAAQPLLLSLSPSDLLISPRLIQLNPSFQTNNRMSLSRRSWLSAASISSHQRRASDSQCFAHYGVNRLLTRHLEAHFHLNVTVVYLTTEHWGSNSPPPPQTGPGCRRRRRAEQERSVWNPDSQLEAATSVQQAT